jgi:hypothetical protein
MQKLTVITEGEGKKILDFAAGVRQKKIVLKNVRWKVSLDDLSNKSRGLFTTNNSTYRAQSSDCFFQEGLSVVTA